MNQPSTEDLQRQLEESRRQQALLQQQLAVQQFAGRYPIELSWPPHVSGNGRTSLELLYHRLLEAGVEFDEQTTTNAVVGASSSFISNLEASDCFHNVHVQIGKPDSDDSNQKTLHVQLQEKNWYKLHVGAGLKSDLWGSASQQQLSTDGFLPNAELDVSVGLRNVAGVLDRTQLQYSLDTHSISTWLLSHKRPLYSLFPETMANAILERELGSQYEWSCRLALDTADHELLSSYKLYQRIMGVMVSTPPNQNMFGSLEYKINYRDLVPRRHPHLPYTLFASNDIVQQAGPSFKHSLIGTVRYEDAEKDSGSQLPIQGTQLHCSTELATPPGDVGYFKAQGALARHWKVLESRMSMHTLVSAGYLHRLSFEGLCRPQSILPCDKFMLGQRSNFRGFVPGGIGPRASNAGSFGDALGGTLFYSATAMVSATPPQTILSGITDHLRLFGFCSTGTCVHASSKNSLQQVLSTSRFSSGLGVATQILGPRLEATYSWPLRFAPTDGRRRAQLGISMSFD